MAKSFSTRIALFCFCFILSSVFLLFQFVDVVSFYDVATNVNLSGTDVVVVVVGFGSNFENIASRRGRG